MKKESHFRVALFSITPTRSFLSVFYEKPYLRKERAPDERTYLIPVWNLYFMLTKGLRDSA